LQDALTKLNELAPDEAHREFLKCCGSPAWARNLVGERPFATVDELLSKAKDVWWSLSANDWLEAFHSHPRIGEQRAAKDLAQQAQAWSEAEQAGSRGAAPETLEALAAGNREYEKRFGYIFIVCATGKSAAEICEILRERLHHDADEELRVAAEEQRKITELRLKKTLTK
jgi:2-oxo-4-hydroxy-4-carboxy-5-ureidoimidazoline decarboxylase